MGGGKSKGIPFHETTAFAGEPRNPLPVENSLFRKGGEEGAGPSAGGTGGMKVTHREDQQNHLKIGKERSWGKGAKNDHMTRTSKSQKHDLKRGGGTF